MSSCELVGALDSTGREMRLDDISGRAVQVTKPAINQPTNQSKVVVKLLIVKFKGVVCRLVW